jgi:hypothetical protein
MPGKLLLARQHHYSPTSDLSLTCTASTGEHASFRIQKLETRFVMMKTTTARIIIVLSFEKNTENVFKLQRIISLVLVHLPV